MGTKNGEDMELKVADAPATYIKREGDLLTLTHDIPTSIESAAASTVSVSREGSQIVVTGEGIKSVSLYNVSGELITTSPSHRLNTSTLKPGVYVLRIETGKQTRAYRFAL